jgi:hypothetical protein
LKNGDYCAKTTTQLQGSCQQRSPMYSPWSL